MAALLAVTCGLAWALASQQLTVTTSQRRALELTQDCKQYQLDAAGVAVAANSVAYDFSSRSDPSADLQSLAQSISAARADSAGLAPLVTGPAEAAELDQAGLALDAYVALTDTIVADFKAGTPSALKAANAGVAALAYHTVTTPLGHLERQIQVQSTSALAASSNRDGRDRLLVVALMLAALGLATGIGTVVTRSITTRLRKTVKVLAEVAAGDMTRRIGVDSTDEVGQMGTALNVALDGVEERARGQRFESRLANALDMAGGEGEVMAVIERSFAFTVPGSPIELLLADNSHAHLQRVAAASPTGDVHGCSVDSPDHCPAARRAQVQHFNDSEALDACPKLLGRPGGRCRALCVPVSIMGRTVGVMHATRALDAPFPDSQLTDFETLAKLAGARVGLLRVMSETQLQAATDGLTGLLNRRSFEHKVTSLRRQGSALSLAMADLDHFKALNDTYGHATGDRALVLFAEILRSSFRSQDVIGRHGGEEFVVALPGCTAANAQRFLDALRSRLDAAITVAGLPHFTVSFGVVEATPQEDLPALIGRADAALFAAKRDGRDRVVVGPGIGDAVASSPGPSGPSTGEAELTRLGRQDYPVPPGCSPGLLSRRPSAPEAHLPDQVG
jgi:diguanylate cyclase (GGDEF)-like protein